MLVKISLPSSLSSIYIYPSLLSISYTVKKLCYSEKSDFEGNVTFFSSGVSYLIPFLDLRAA